MKKLLFILSSLFLLTGSKTATCQIAGKWKLLGPIEFPLDSGGEINGIGRIEQIKFDPVNPSTVYALSAGGGLFVSTNDMATWSSTGTDSAAFGNNGNSAASVCIDYTNDNILYLGTGDANYYSDRYGIWKSTDGGATWAASNSGIGNRLAVEILMSPHDHNTLIAATDDGIWKSIDAGATWTEKVIGGQFTDMQFKPNATTTTIYAASYNAFYYSNDMGDTWTNVALPVPALSLEQGGRLGVTKADSNIVFLTYCGNDSALTTPVLKSDNSGQSFFVVKPADSCDLNGYDTANYGQYYQGNYNYALIVDPNDTNTLYIAAEMVWKSTDGGVHWSTNYWWWAGVHCDMHYFAFDPNNSSVLYCANDGGIFKTTDNSATWTTSSNGISATEFYHATCSPIKQNSVCGGSQDNGSFYFYTATPWVTFQAGDVGSYWDADYVDSTSFYEPSSDTRQYYTGWNYINLPFSYSNSDLLAFPATQTTTAFASDSDVWISNDITTLSPAWTKISTFNKPIVAFASSPSNANVLYAVSSNNRFHFSYNALSATPTWAYYNTPASVANGACIAIVKNDTNVIYMSCGSSVFRSIDRAANWTNITGSLPPVNIINLINDPYSPTEGTYLATADAVWYKDTTMANWLNFSKGLPNTCWITNMMMFDNGTDSSYVRISFYGRGIWQSQLYSTLLTGTKSLLATNGQCKIYPNPNNGSFIVSLSSNDEAQIEIYNLIGQRVYQSSLKKGNTEINLNSQASGMYLYKISTLSGEYISGGKIVEE